MGLFILLVYGLGYGIPLASVAGLLWLIARVARRWMPRPAATALAWVLAAMIVVGEIIPSRLAENIAQRSAEDVQHSVPADSILFDSAGAAGEALAANAQLAFTEGVAEGRDSQVFAGLPLGRIRFSGAYSRLPDRACGSGELEVPDMSAPRPGISAPLKCIKWRQVPDFEARYGAFLDRRISYRAGLYLVTEYQQGLARRSDGRRFNVAKDVEVTGGLWWHLVNMWGDLTGMGGNWLMPPHASGTYFYLPKGEVTRFLFVGARRPVGRPGRSPG